MFLDSLTYSLQVLFPLLPSCPLLREKTKSVGELPGSLVQSSGQWFVLCLENLTRGGFSGILPGPVLLLLWEGG